MLPYKYSTVYNELHKNLGHLGTERVVDLARIRLYWPNMASDVEDFIRKKCRCLVDKKPNQTEKAPLITITVTHPFEMIYIDLLHLDRCKGGFEYVLTVCDHFTRFIQA